MKMESFMNGTLLVEATLLSFLLALWMTWLGLNGLLRLLSASSSYATPSQDVAHQGHAAPAVALRKGLL